MKKLLLINLILAYSFINYGQDVQVGIDRKVEIDYIDSLVNAINNNKNLKTRKTNDPLVLTYHYELGFTTTIYKFDSVEKKLYEVYSESGNKTDTITNVYYYLEGKPILIIIQSTRDRIVRSQTFFYFRKKKWFFFRGGFRDDVSSRSMYKASMHYLKSFKKWKY